MASIFDVARMAKVSPSTVSLVVNHSHRVSSTTRKKVESAIRKLDYRGREGQPIGKSRTARALRLAFIYTPGAMVDGADTLYNRQLIQGIEQSLQGSTSSLSIMRGYSHVDEDHMLCQRLEAREFDGILIAGVQASDGYIQRVRSVNLPAVVFNRSTDSGTYSVVAADYRGGGQQAIDHLVSLGHRRIGLLLQSEEPRWPTRLLREGCLEAMARHQLEPMADEVVPTCLDALGAICKRMVDAGVTAIQTGDVDGMRLLELLAGMGLRVPEDISVMGFDDRGQASPTGQTLTTIGYDKVRMGRLAGRMIQKLSRPRSAAQWLGVAVKTHFVAGQTTAAPAS